MESRVTLQLQLTKEQHNRVTGFLEAGRQEGVEVVAGGKVMGNQGYFVEPTVLAQTNRSMKVVREEIFGPVVCVQSFDDADLNAVPKFANDIEPGDCERNFMPTSARTQVAPRSVCGDF